MLPEIPGLNTGEVEKLQIIAFTDAGRTKRAADPSVFAVMYNPSSYTHRFKVGFHIHQPRGKESTEPVFTGIPPQQMTIDFVLDGTGASNPPNPVGVGIAVPAADKLFPNIDVSKQVSDFLSVTTGVSESDHRTKYLKIVWGKGEKVEKKRKVVDCVMTSADVNYTLFRSDGVPLRAKIKAEFLVRNPFADFSSPDLTHRRSVTEGDNLPLLSEQIYDSPNHYIELARTNRLKHFRRLQVGRELRFFPFEDEISS